jgi:hypothetical protein
MGKIKEVYIEIMNMYDGEIPEDFDFNKYLLERNKLKSSCCGADLTLMVNEDLSYEDICICPKCKEHC